MRRVEGGLKASISELRNDPSLIVENAKAEAVAILNRNRVVAYVLSAEMYESFIDRLDDLTLIEIAIARAREKSVPVELADL